jgi:hypothetical protein
VSVFALALVATCGIKASGSLIEVKKRPALYLKSLKEYSDTNHKKKLWEEVCTDLIENWKDLSPEEKKTEGNCLYFR